VPETRIPQQGPLAVLEKLEEWADAGGIRNLARRLEASPSSHRSVLLTQWSELQETLEKGIHLEETPTGSLRPAILNTSWLQAGLDTPALNMDVRLSPRPPELDAVVSTAARLLLFVDQVVLPYSLVHGPLFERHVSAWVAALADLKPLIEDGSVLFTGPYEQGTPIAEAVYYRMPTLGLVTSDAYNATYGMYCLEDVMASTICCVEHQASPLSANYLDERHWSGFWEVIKDDKRRTVVDSLARLSVPAASEIVGELVAIRQSSECFAELRDAIGDAMQMVGQAPLGESLDSWRSQFGDEMRHQLSKVEAEVRRSPLKDAASASSWTLSFSGLGLGAAAGAAIGAGIGNPPTGAVTGAASVAVKEAATFGRTLVKAAGKHRKANALWSIATSFSG
jgi:hypothetical protein